MPISVQELDEAQRPIADRMLQFLETKKGFAFTAAELFMELQLRDDMSAKMLFMLSPKDAQAEATQPFAEALVGLVKAGKLRSAQVNGSQYFTLRGS